jgi:ribosomal 50S subunit-associated protein YjgA (DUF615 family)
MGEKQEKQTMTESKHPRDLLARIIEENPDADRAELRRLFREAVKEDEPASDLLGTIINEVFDDLMKRERKR